MKLARTTTHTVCYGRPESASLRLASCADRVFPQKAAVQPIRRLTSRWHVSPQTGRLECSWLLEANSDDPPLYWRPRKRRVLARSLSHRRNRRH